MKERSTVRNSAFEPLVTCIPTHIEMKVLVAQLGARMHYAVPRMLYEAGMLEMFYTDICATKSWPQLFRLWPAAFRPPALKRLLARIPEGVPCKCITAFNGLGRSYARKRRNAKSPSETTAAYLWGGRRFCEEVLRRDWGGATAVYTFNSAGLEVLAAARKRGLIGVVEQTMAPRQLERELLCEERIRHAEWEPDFTPNSNINDFIAREMAEWKEASLILCGSEFVKQGIRDCGGPVKKCLVVPYGVDTNFKVPTKRGRHTGPLRVLTVGAVGLRKGSPYVLEAAKALKGKAEFRMVGSVGITSKASDRLREHVELLGAVPRNEILKQYEWADVFFLPSLCEGSATVTYEALACGLPVIATPNTGSIVNDGEEGFIVPIRDTASMIGRLELLASDTDLRESMTLKATSLAQSYTLGNYSERLINALKLVPGEIQ